MQFKVFKSHNWRLISEKNPTYTLILFWKFFLPTRLIEPTRLFNFGNCSYLHVISNCALIKEVRVVKGGQNEGSNKLSTYFCFFSLLKTCKKFRKVSMYVQVFMGNPTTKSVCSRVLGIRHE